MNLWIKFIDVQNLPFFIDKIFTKKRNSKLKNDMILEVL
jgi:hypothetical protein